MQVTGSSTLQCASREEYDALVANQGGIAEAGGIARTFDPVNLRMTMTIEQSFVLVAGRFELE